MKFCCLSFGYCIFIYRLVYSNRISGALFVKLPPCLIKNHKAVVLYCEHKAASTHSWLPPLNFYRWQSEKSGERLKSNVVSTRFFSGSHQRYSMPTCSGHRCKENVTLVTTFDLLYISCTTCAHWKVHIMKIVRYNAVFVCLFEMHFLLLCNSLVGQDISVGIATRYGLDGPGIESRWVGDFPHRPWHPPILL
jgi:hypothetical protein